MVNFKKLRQMIEIKGNGNIVSKEIQVSSFLRLHIAGRGMIELIQSGDEKVVVETDENLQDYFEAQNSGGTLYVTAEAKLRKPLFTRCLIKIYFRQLDALVIRCDGGDVTCPNPITVLNPIDIKIQSRGNSALNIEAPAIKLLSQCEGDVVLKGKCGSITIKNQSQGAFSSKELRAEDLTIKNMAEGNIEVYADKTISISHFGAGYVHYYGNAVLKDVKQFGSGEIKHFDK